MALNLKKKNDLRAELIVGGNWRNIGVDGWKIKYIRANKDGAYLWSTAEDVAASLSVDKLCWLHAFELSGKQTELQYTVKSEESLHFNKGEKQKRCSKTRSSLITFFNVVSLLASRICNGYKRSIISYNTFVYARKGDNKVHKGQWLKEKNARLH